MRGSSEVVREAICDLFKCDIIFDCCLCESQADLHCVSHVITCAALSLGCSLASYQRSGARRSVNLLSCIVSSHKGALPSCKSWYSRCTTSYRALVALLPWPRTAGVGATASVWNSVRKPLSGQVLFTPADQSRTSAGPAVAVLLQVTGSLRHKFVCHCLQLEGFESLSRPCLSHADRWMWRATPAKAIVAPVRGARTIR